jgi:hypothetical protein
MLFSYYAQMDVAEFTVHFFYGAFFDSTVLEIMSTVKN